MPDDNKPDWGMPYYTLPWEYSSRIIHKHGWMKAYDADVVPSEMVFGAITAGNQSAQQIATVVNAGYLPLTIKSINVTGDWLVSSDCPTDTPLMWVNPAQYRSFSSHKELECSLERYMSIPETLLARNMSVCSVRVWLWKRIGSASLIVHGISVRLLSVPAARPRPLRSLT